MPHHHDSAARFHSRRDVLIEAAVYALCSRPRDLPKALLASALANAASYAAGLFLFH